MSSPHSGSFSSELSPLILLNSTALRRVLAVGFIVTAILGTTGYRQYQQLDQEKSSLGNAIYHTAQLFVLHAPHFEKPVPWALEVARWLAPMTTLLGLIDFARRMFRQEIRQRVLERLNGHIVVCGLGRKGFELVRQLRKGKGYSSGPAVVVIDEAPRPDLAAECEELGAFVVVGDATRPEVLLEARVEHAARLFAVCAADTTNCEIAAQACHLYPANGTLECNVHFSTVDLREAFEQTIRAQPGLDQIQLRFVDVLDPEALGLLLHELPLDHNGIGPSDHRTVHLVILGFGAMGRTLALRAAQLGMFANGKRLRISVIDRLADKHRAELLFRHPQIEQVVDFSFQAHEVLSPKVRQLVQGWCAEPDALTSIAVCFNQEALSVEIALRLLPFFDKNDVRVAVRLARQSGLAHLLEQVRRKRAPEAAVTGPPCEPASLMQDRLARIRPFGMEERFARLAEPEAESLEKSARAIHQAYVELTLRRLREQRGDSEKTKAELTDWNALNEELRESNRQQAAHLVFKLRAIGCEIVPAEAERPAVEKFTAEELELLARMEHARWVIERKIANWSFAEEKDLSLRKNPNLVPWEHLKDEVREFDRAAIVRVPELLHAIGKKICRRAIKAE